MQDLRNRVFVIAIVSSLLIATAAMAEAPRLISYQGRAADASNNPVPDGVHSVRFDLFNHPTTGTGLWGETASVTTSGGLFTHILGSITPILESQFRYYVGLYLQITFDGEVQLPRTQFTSTGYSFHVQSIHNSEGGNIIGDLAIYNSIAGNEIAGINGDANGEPILWMNGSERRILLNTGIIDGNISGFMSIYNNNINETVASIYADTSGEPGLALNGSERSILFNAGVSGSGSVELPMNAIQASEIQDEPGIACAIDTQMTIFETTTAVDVVTISLTIPAGGYIFVEAKFKVVATGMGQNFGWIQIDETSGGGRLDPYATVFGQDTLFIDNAANQGPGYASRVYYKSVAGTYTFRLEGAESPGNCANCTPQVDNSILVATYYPAAYGSVSGFVSGAEAGQFETATPVQAEGEIMYQVDFRELELKAAKTEAEAERANAKAERAKRQLLEAQMEQSSQ